MNIPAWLLKYLPLILTGTIWVLTFGIGYYQGYTVCNTSWKDKSQVQENQYLNRLNELTGMIRQSEINAQKKINAIVSEQIESEERIRNEYETVIADLRNGQYQFSGVRECPSESAGKSVPSKTGNPAGLVCYSEAELRSKIERSLAIAEECDRLAEKYEKLKEVYYVGNGR